ncbi:MAG: hypothetical protein R6V55_09715 [Desulfovermiculus sp.]
MTERGVHSLQEILKSDPEARILLASGYSSEHDAKDILQKGAAAFLGKPFLLSDFLNIVQELLNNGQAKNYN